MGIVEFAIVGITHKIWKNRAQVTIITIINFISKYLYFNRINFCEFHKFFPILRKSISRKLATAPLRESLYKLFHEFSALRNFISQKMYYSAIFKICFFHVFLVYFFYFILINAKMVILNIILLYLKFLSYYIILSFFLLTSQIIQTSRDFGFFKLMNILLCGIFLKRLHTIIP